MNDAEFLNAMEERCKLETAQFLWEEGLRARRLAGLPKGPLSVRMVLQRNAMQKYVRIAKQKAAARMKERLTK